DSEAAASRRRLAEDAVRQILIARAADLLSGPGGLAAWLRTGLLDGPAASVSLPLDVGAATETIPAHLRRAVIVRDRCCRFPGCDQPPAGCQPHHIIPRSQGGPTSLTNLLLLCSFHHLIAVHRWGWDIVLLPDGTVTATSPDRSRTLRSHGPPSRAA
ncbi:MAG TPA: HNH endonuclease signature motif containing protein, partial [Streptosporangiaceae bacterium]|nr:HNH endonuclease signature motif containing protein [Streptosporangiaceae bacterium]